MKTLAEITVENTKAELAMAIASGNHDRAEKLRAIIKIYSNPQPEPKKDVRMNEVVRLALIKIHQDPSRPHSTCPGYECWLAQQIYEEAQKHFAALCGPHCAQTVLND